MRKRFTVFAYVIVIIEFIIQKQLFVNRMEDAISNVGLLQMQVVKLYLQRLLTHDFILNLFLGFPCKTFYFTSIVSLSCL